MAGAGYKLFNTGDVLTAAQVNTYLMEQSVMVFADAAARTTALSGVVAEGMLSYLKDTNAVEVYNGSAWVASDDPNAIQNTIVDAKGDLIAASANDTPARLAVGNNGETLVADSSATTGLAYREDYAAGKNKIINGDFNINQRGFTSITTSAQYGFDRWALGNVGNFGTVTYTPETFTLGAAPVAGYEGKTFARVVTTGQTQTNVLTTLRQPIESVRTFANDTVTVSFWAKAASGTPKIAVNLEQNFGTGGSPSSSVDNYLGQATLTTSWVRYSVSGSVASISGKTLGTANNDYLLATLIVSAGTDFNAKSGSLGIQSNTFDIWGVQVESGSVATAFQTATGTLAGELAACQRYYYRLTAAANGASLGIGWAAGATDSRHLIYFPAEMRVTPTSIDFSTLEIADSANPAIDITAATLNNASNTRVGVVGGTVAGATQYRPYALRLKTASTSHLGFSAEL